MKWVACGLAAVVVSSAAADVAQISAFSAAPAQALPAPWREVHLPRIKPPTFSIVTEEGSRVLRVHAENAAGTAMHPLDADPRATPMLSWRWKVDRMLEKADMTLRSGDDFPARVYVFFDVPIADLPVSQRARIRIARAFYGTEVPTAALCYVWDNRQPVGTFRPNPYTDRVRTVVLESGAARIGQWVVERRNVEDDFRKAFAHALEKPVPRITGISVAADTDQTGETVTTWFGDLRLEAGK